MRTIAIRCIESVTGRPVSRAGIGVQTDAVTIQPRVKLDYVRAVIRGINVPKERFGCPLRPEERVFATNDQEVEFAEQRVECGLRHGLGDLPVGVGLGERGGLRDSGRYAGGCEGLGEGLYGSLGVGEREQLQRLPVCNIQRSSGAW